ncbi:MAG: polyphosphate polymerase domain-containing protein [Verrucomicrobia bacterium]|nr:polyphosphate polymerase domain-containing protein [Verrucomicrobiota bacterium]
MAPTVPALRYERKWVASPLSLIEVLAVVRRHPALFVEVYPPRCINNIYFDTPGLADYHAHVNGIARRCKTRIRWYGDLDGDIARPVLELKVKRGLLGWKEQYALPRLRLPGVGTGGMNLRPWVEALSEANLRDRLLSHQPVLLNRYQRRYFRSSDRGYRLTVDWGLEFRRYDGVDGAPFGRTAAADPIVLELKYERGQAEGFERVARALPFRLTRFSKYVYGVDRLHGS